MVRLSTKTISIPFLPRQPFRTVHGEGRVRMGEKTIRDTRREEIIIAARDLFSRKGYHGTSMPDIARAAGISTGLIYYVFPSKEEILVACSQRILDLHLGYFQETSEIADPLERFDYIVRELYRSLDKGSKML